MTNNRIGGMDRAKIAREEIIAILSDETNKHYFDKDIDFAKKYKVTRHTIYKIREVYGIPSRSDRILRAIKDIDWKNISIKDISKKLGIKYQNLYKIVNDNFII